MPNKRINRNAFNEKLIHRYLFERLYFGDQTTIKKLLPERCHKLKINLITPESSQGNYRADLMIYFKNTKSGLPIEVKWNLKSAIKPNQINYLKKHKGVLISFDKIKGAQFKGVDHIQIDHKDFQDWTAHNISKLSRESLIYQAAVPEISGGAQFWVVFLRGTAWKNWDRMMNLSAKKPFWAYTQNSKALKNIFDIQQNDLCLFITGVASEGIGMSDKPELSFEYRGWYLTRIKTPYYMALDDERGVFFEAGNVAINKRRWPHFTDFDILESFDARSLNLKTINFGKRGEISTALANSANYGGGTPTPLLRRQWGTLIDTLRKQKKQSLLAYNSEN